MLMAAREVGTRWGQGLFIAGVVRGAGGRSGDSKTGARFKHKRAATVCCVTRNPRGLGNVQLDSVQVSRQRACLAASASSGLRGLSRRERGSDLVVLEIDGLYAPFGYLHVSQPRNRV